MKTAISVPNPIFESAEQFAHRLEITRSELYVRAIKSYIEAHRDDGVTEALNQLYATESSSLDPVVAQLQSASIPGDEW
jgi:metal-responsive CopG/Arc/MetJ family transcriptional regulator